MLPVGKLRPESPMSATTPGRILPPRHTACLALFLSEPVDYRRANFLEAVHRGQGIAGLLERDAAPD